MKLTDYAVLSFDCYGTLIDWETGLFAAFGPLMARSGVRQTRDEVLEAFGHREAAQQALTPTMPDTALLSEVHGQFATGWGVARDVVEDARFGNSVADWPAFADTVEALIYLKQYFRLLILSNVDRISFNATNRRLGVLFDAIYTAEDAGCYKPDLKIFRYLLDQIAQQNVSKEQVLHIAQSLFHDHVPANALGIASVWIDRRYNASGWGATAPVPTQVRYTYRFNSLGELAKAHMAENTSFSSFGLDWLRGLLFRANRPAMMFLNVVAHTDAALLKLHHDLASPGFPFSATCGGSRLNPSADSAVRRHEMAVIADPIERPTFQDYDLPSETSCPW